MTGLAVEPSGFRRWALAWLATAVLYAASFPPLGFDLLILVAFVPLMVAGEKAIPLRGFRRAAFLGLAVMGGQQLFWISAMSNVGALSWVGWLAVTALYLILATPLVIALRGVRRRGWAFGPCLALAIPGHEIVREALMSGLSWASPGYALGNRPLLIQTAELGDVHVVSLVVLFINAALAAVVAGRDRRLRIATIVAGVLCGALAIGYGAWRADAVEAAARPGPLVLGLQPNVTLEERAEVVARRASPSWQFLTRRLDIAAAGRDEARGRDQDIDLVIWPETSVPPLDEARAAKRLVAYPPDRLLGRTGRRALAPRFSAVFGDEGPEHLVGLQLYSDRNAGEEAATRYGHAERNVALLLGPEAGALSERGRYAKHHLVPFGERVPDIPGRESLKRLIDERAGFAPALTPGTGDGVMRRGRDAEFFGASICYEIIFPGLFAEQRRQGAAWFANISNDVWYGDSAEMELVHLALRFRAVENRRAIFRVGNTGISALIDASGREIAVVEREGRRRHVAGHLLARVPLSKAQPAPDTARMAFRWALTLIAVLGGLGASFGKSFRSEDLGSED